MRIPEKLKFLMLASMSCLLSVAANAEIEGGEGAAGTSTASAVDQSRNGATDCVDLDDDCSTLIVNYSGDAVQFAMFKNDGKTGSSDSKNAASDSSGALLAADFLRGLNSRVHNTLPNSETDTVHDWAFAAATTTDSTVQHSNPAGISPESSSAGSAPIFWDFERVYLWEVGANVLESGGYNLAQVALSEIYLSPKVNSATDPDIVVCEVNDANNCRPLSD